MRKKKIDKFIKQNVKQAVLNFKKDLENDEKIKEIVDFFRSKKFDIHHPDVSPKTRAMIFDIMNRYPCVSFIEHCLIANFYTIREDSNVSFEINPQGSGDEVLIGDINLLNYLKNEKDGKTN
jgi:hypothetical protein